MAMPMLREYEVTEESGSARDSEVRRAWPARSPQPTAVEFALHDAQNMLALLAANVEFLVQPPGADSVAVVAGDIQESTRRLGNLLNVVAALLKTPE